MLPAAWETLFSLLSTLSLFWEHLFFSSLSTSYASPTISPAFTLQLLIDYVDVVFLVFVVAV